MCGIGGVMLSEARPGLDLVLRSMKRRLAHRGPDGEGDWLSPEKKLGLCHTRLAILDLSANALQPMVSADGQCVIVFNGEIYNWRDLRRQLEARGHRFRTRSDTEVLLEAYREWGEEALFRLRGMFAFAIYDAKENVLLCARDRVGKKPFVYAEGQWGFAFGSEIPAVLEAASLIGADTSLDHSALAALLLHNLRHIPDPCTVYCGLRRLRAGHAMRVRNGRVERLWRYWDPRHDLHELPRPVAADMVRRTLEEAVELRLQADVPVGALLSGGVDSSAIVALAQARSEGPLRTYTLGFDAADEDLRRAREMAAWLGTLHREFYFDPERQWEVFGTLLATHGEPIMLLPLVHTHELCQAIREDGIKVVLAGHGADELFYGYTGHLRTFRVSRWLDGLGRLLPAMRVLRVLGRKGPIGLLTAPPGERKATYYAWLAEREWETCLSPDAKAEIVNVAADEMAYWGTLCPSRTYIDESNFIALMVEDTHSVTTASDLPAMAAGVEMRAPFLDQKMVSLALSISADGKIPDLRDASRLKAILRDAVSDLLPPELLHAPKRGFGMGIQEGMVLKGPWRCYGERLFSMPHDAEGLFDPEALRRTWAGFLDGCVPPIRAAKHFAIQAWLQGTA